MKRFSIAVLVAICILAMPISVSAHCRGRQATVPASCEQSSICMVDGVCDGSCTHTGGCLKYDGCNSTCTGAKACVKNGSCNVNHTRVSDVRSGRHHSNGRRGGCH